MKKSEWIFQNFVYLFKNLTLLIFGCLIRSADLSDFGPGLFLCDLQANFSIPSQIQRSCETIAPVLSSQSTLPNL